MKKKVLITALVLSMVFLFSGICGCTGSTQEVEQSELVDLGMDSISFNNGESKYLLDDAVPFVKESWILDNQAAAEKLKELNSYSYLSEEMSVKVKEKGLSIEKWNNKIPITVEKKVSDLIFTAGESADKNTWFGGTIYLRSYSMGEVIISPFEVFLVPGESSAVNYYDAKYISLSNSNIINGEMPEGIWKEDIYEIVMPSERYWRYIE